MNVGNEHADGRSLVKERAKGDNIAVALAVAVAVVAEGYAAETVAAVSRAVRAPSLRQPVSWDRGSGLSFCLDYLHHLHLASANGYAIYRLHHHRNNLDQPIVGEVCLDKSKGIGKERKRRWIYVSEGSHGGGRGCDPQRKRTPPTP